MYCHEARHLVGLGMEPGTADPVRTTLGFHLATCAACRAYRNQLHNQQLLYALLAQEAPTPEPIIIAPASYSRRIRTGIRVASSALLLSGMLALSSAGAVAKAANAPSSADTAKLAPCVAPASRSANVVSSTTLSAKLVMADRHTDVSAVTVDPANMSAFKEVSAPEGIESLALEAGVELFIPAQPIASGEVNETPVQQPAGLGVYVVQPGDTLSAIAQRYYGNAGWWYVIYNANQGLIGGNANLIYPGQRLSIPSVGNSPPPGGGQTGQGQGSYTVRAGDTLTSIAQFAYGNASLWGEIYKANRGVIGANPSVIIPGQQLTIPSLQLSQGIQTNTPYNPPQNGSYYQVQSGDTLSAIAQRAYGNAALWYIIYNANQGVIGGNPNLIYPGQQYIIPYLS